MIVVPEEGCGPAMLALTPAQRAFVVAKVHFGCTNAEAARRAGYSKSQPSDAKVTAYRLAHSENIIAAIVEESRKVMAGEGPRSIKTLVEIRDSKSGEAKDRIKAAIELLNRGGLNAVSEHHHVVEHTMTDAQKDRRILELAKELGLPDTEARKLLIAPEAVDAEFTEVEPPNVGRTSRRERENELRRQREAMTPGQLSAHKREMRKARRAKAKERYAEAQRSMSSEGIEDLLMEIPHEP
jgi:hypothetical protein